MDTPDDLPPFHKWTKGIPGGSLESGLGRPAPVFEDLKFGSSPDAPQALDMLESGLGRARPFRERSPLDTATRARPIWGDFDLAAPSPIFVGSVVEIATSLSRLARFNGWGPRFYSVAEHSILCDEIARADGVPALYRRAVLFHDTAEVYCGDDIRPKKAIVPELQKLEDRVFAAIAERFDIPVGYGVAAYDDLALAVELRDLFPDDPRDGLPEPGIWQTPRLDPDAAALEFARRAEALGIR